MPVKPATAARPSPARWIAGALTALAALAMFATPAGAAVWTVGPGQAFERFADVLRVAGDGDTIRIASGTYRGDVAVITQRRLTIEGVGERPVFAADGHDAEGKAIWVVRNGDIRIENIAFSGARVAHHNGAGIRFEHGRLQIVGCSFTDNQTGLMSSNDGVSELDIVDSEFSAAPVNPGGLPHLLYVGRIERFSISGSRFRQGRLGHLIKSRAHVSVIVGNTIDDGVDGQASYEIDLPNGGRARIEGNTIGQSRLAENVAMVSFGAEGQPWDDSSLDLVDNTFINRLGERGFFVRVWAARLPADTPVHSRGNRLLGGGSLALGPNGDSVDDLHGPLPPP